MSDDLRCIAINDKGQVAFANPRNLPAPSELVVSDAFPGTKLRRRTILPVQNGWLLNNFIGLNLDGQIAGTTSFWYGRAGGSTGEVMGESQVNIWDMANGASTVLATSNWVGIEPSQKWRSSTDAKGGTTNGLTPSDLAGFEGETLVFNTRGTPRVAVRCLLRGSNDFATALISPTGTFIKPPPPDVSVPASQDDQGRIFYASTDGGGARHYYLFDGATSQEKEILGPAGFDVLCLDPAISPDGSVFAFWGTPTAAKVAEMRTVAGEGIFLGVFLSNGTTKIMRVTGGIGELGMDSANSPISIDVRCDSNWMTGIGVVHRKFPGSNAPDEVRIVFEGTPSAESTYGLFSAESGIWTVRVSGNFSELPPEWGFASAPVPVAQLGDTIGGEVLTDVGHNFFRLASYEPSVVDPRRPHQRDEHQIAFVARTATGSKLIRASWIDSDGDGLSDDWETNGFRTRIDMVEQFINLKAMGADPKFKDVFIQVEWMGASSAPPALASSEPDQVGIREVQRAFLDSGVINPVKQTGINLHVDAGPKSWMNPRGGPNTTWGNLSQSLSGRTAPPGPSPITWADSYGHFNYVGGVARSFDWSALAAIKDVRFSRTGRSPAFRYTAFVRHLGVAGVPAADGITNRHLAVDFIVGVGAINWPTANLSRPIVEGGTFMHELGHTLSLRHAGDNEESWKPNYLSMMNYSYNATGLVLLSSKVENGNTVAELDYSKGTLAPLNENSLNESPSAPVSSRYYCIWGKWLPSAPWKRLAQFNAFSNPIWKNQRSKKYDWNGDDLIAPVDSPVSENIGGGPAPGEIITGFEDWPFLVYKSVGIGASAPDRRVTDGSNTEDVIQSPIQIPEAPERPGGNRAPVADFSYVQNYEGGPVCDFDASASYDPDGSVATWKWDFGDGSTGSGQSISHTFTTTGMHRVSLLVEDTLGGSSELINQQGVPVFSDLSLSAPTVNVTSEAGGTVDVVFSVHNAGALTDVGSQLSFKIPDDHALVSYTSSSSVEMHSFERDLLFDLGSVTPGATITVSVTLRTACDANGGEDFAVVARAEPFVGELTPADNQATVTLHTTNQGPVVTSCPPARILTAAAGGCTASVPDLTNEWAVSFPCAGIVGVFQSPSAGTTLPLGATTVTLTARVGGQQAQCLVEVTVVDAEAPTLSACPQSVSVAAEECAGRVVTYVAPSASDSCSSAVVSCAPASGSLFPIGVTSVVCTATDAAGNTSQCSFTVTCSAPEAIAPIISVVSASVCANSANNTATTAAAGPYAWTISGGTITSATNVQTITYTAGSTGSVALGLTVGSGGCVSSASPVTVAINASPATPVITVPANGSSACAGSTGLTVSGSAAGMWSISGGVIDSGQGTSSITFHPTGVAGQTVLLGLTVTNASGCSVAADPVTIPLSGPLPTTAGPITGSANPSALGSGSYSVGPVAGAVQYRWTAPSDALITGATAAGQAVITTSPSVQITFGRKSGLIAVAPRNACGAGATSSMEVEPSFVEEFDGAVGGATPRPGWTVSNAATYGSWIYPTTTQNPNSDDQSFATLSATSSGVAQILYNAASFTDFQYDITFARTGTSASSLTDATALIFRHTNGAVTNYSFLITREGKFSVQRRDGQSQTILLNYGQAGQHPSGHAHAGETLIDTVSGAKISARVRAEGSMLRFYLQSHYDGLYYEVAQVTDATYGSGFPGLSVYRSSAGLSDAFHVYRAQVGAPGSFKADGVGTGSDEVPISEEQERANLRANGTPVLAAPDGARRR